MNQDLSGSTDTFKQKLYDKAWQQATYYMQNINKSTWHLCSICALWQIYDRSKCWTSLNLSYILLIILQSNVAMGPQVLSITKTWYCTTGQDLTLIMSPFSKYWNYFIMCFPLNRHLMFQIQFSLGTFECFYFFKNHFIFNAPVLVLSQILHCCPW